MMSILSRIKLSYINITYSWWKKYNEIVTEVSTATCTACAKGKPCTDSLEPRNHRSVNRTSNEEK